MSFARKLLPAAVAGLALVAAPAYADVTVVESLDVQGSALLGMANMSGKSTTIISGKNGRTESDVKMKSALARMFAGGQTAEITRLGDDKIYELDLKKKQYTETSLAERRAQLQKSIDEAKQQRAEQQKATTPVNQSKCEWSEPKSDLKKTGEKATVAGFEAERSVLTVTQSCKLKETGEVCDFGLALDQWLAPSFEGAAERDSFYKAYAEQMGFASTSSRDFAKSAEALFAGYKPLWDEIAKKSSTLKGYPVRSTLALAVGGAQCKSTQTGSSSPGAQDVIAATAQLGDAIGGLFNKKKKTEEAAPAQAAPAVTVNGLLPSLTVSTELVSISHAAVAAELFAPPADFKKTTAP